MNNDPSVNGGPSVRGEASVDSTGSTGSTGSTDSVDSAKDDPSVDDPSVDDGPFRDGAPAGDGGPSANDVRLGWALAASGWLTLAVYTLADANPVRVAVSGVFLLCCPGLAAVRSARPRLAAAGAPMGRLESWVMVVALSLAIDTLIIVAFYLTGGFISGWALAAVAGATTLLALPQCFPRRRRPPGGPPRAGRRDGGRTGGRHRGGSRDGHRGDHQDGHGNEHRAHDRDRGRGERRRRRAAAAGAGTAGLLLVAACAGGGASSSPSAAGDSGGAAGGTSAPGRAPADPAAPGSWHLAFQDGFDGDRLNRSNWTTCYDWNQDGCTNAGNHELEWYRPQQVTVGGGDLTLTAKRSATEGSDGTTYPWTSGMVSTGRDSWNAQPRHTFTYGYFAAAVRIPPEAGMFPAFWLLPESRTTPPELDVAEFISTTQYVQMTVHYTGPNGEDKDQWERYGPQDFPAGYHVFAVDWESDSLTWYVDGVQRYQVTDPEKIPHTAMEVLLNLAVGYPSSPPQSVDTARMTVDWVRVWQH
ncbi:glycoside hydrolase family 16 protein [Kitasatospora sp. NPDC096140]|uniref:glycoside hydrolase family 16 protein n=1 Tax=Kitasatospora sp. NPDC096140 TaxID=3155425 RepID=UPI0033224671